MLTEFRRKQLEKIIKDIGVVNVTTLRPVNPYNFSEGTLLCSKHKGVQHTLPDDPKDVGELFMLLDPRPYVVITGRTSGPCSG